MDEYHELYVLFSLQDHACPLITQTSPSEKQQQNDSWLCLTCVLSFGQQFGGCLLVTSNKSRKGVLGRGLLDTNELHAPDSSASLDPSLLSMFA